MANSYFYSNTAVQTTLSGSISAGATSVGVAATTGFPGSVPYVLALDYGASTEELVKVTAVAGTTLTVERGFSGTSAQSHSLSAVVRHVYHAGDATDFRTHEAATSGVHGVTGTLVGTSDTQTLANKTLTSPTINSGALSGTFTGAPTFSGVINHTAAVQSTQSAASNTSLAAIVTADTFDRFRILADGDMEWGPGNAARDVQLYRDAANVLATNDTVRVYGASTTADAFQARVTGDTVSRLNIDADGAMAWGPGGSSAQDTNLYRSFASELQTDGNFTVIGNLEAANITTGAWTSYTPTWTASGSNPVLGNGTLVGLWAKVGRTYVVHINLIPGSTTTFGSGTYSFALPVAAASSGATYIGNAHLLGTDRWAGQYLVSPGFSSASPSFPASATNTRHSLWSPTVPETFASGSQMRITVVYEGAS